MEMNGWTETVHMGWRIEHLSARMEREGASIASQPTATAARKKKLCFTPQPVYAENTSGHPRTHIDLLTPLQVVRKLPRPWLTWEKKKVPDVRYASKVWSPNDWRFERRSGSRSSRLRGPALTPSRVNADSGAL